jgi:hypothetical protein
MAMLEFKIYSSSFLSKILTIKIPRIAGWCYFLFMGVKLVSLREEKLKLALTSPTSGGRSVGIVGWLTKAPEFVCLFV